VTVETTKDFAPIRDDYTFFETHSTEAENDLRGYERLLQDLPRAGSLRLLDFGCGPGTFSERFLTMLGVDRATLRLFLVEPVEVYRQQAVQRLAHFTAHPIEACPALPADHVDCFDLIVSNHVFYYLPDLDRALGQTLAGLAPGGRFVTAIAGRDNALIQFWVKAFALLDRPIPYNIAEDVEAWLHKRGQPYARQQVRYDLTFPDSEENRLKILRFLLSEHLPALPRQEMLDLFSPHAQGGRIVLSTDDVQFLIRKGA
jgi:trans-aconitate 2-methyltransferase